MALSLQQWCEQIEQPELYEKLVGLDFSTVNNLLDLPESDVTELVQELGLKFGKKSKFLGGLKDLQASGRNRDIPTAPVFPTSLTNSASISSATSTPPRNTIPTSTPSTPSKPNTNSPHQGSGSASSQGGKYDTVISRMKADADSIQSFEIPLELANPHMDIHQCIMLALGSLWQTSAYQQLYQSIMAHAQSNPEIQHLIRSNNNVTMDGLLSLVYFTSDIRPYGGVEDDSVFRLVNKALYSRDSGSLKCWLPFLFHAFEAYRHLPKYTGTVYRGITKKVLEESLLYKPGSEIVWVAFTSTSKSTDVMRSFSGDSGTWFVLECEGIELSFSMFPRESEILLFPNTRLKVTGLLTEEMRRLSNFPDNFNVIQLSHVQRPRFAVPQPIAKSKSSSSSLKSKSSKSSKKDKDKSSSKRKVESGTSTNGTISNGTSFGNIGSVNGPIITGSNVNVTLSSKNEALERESLEIQKALLAEKQKNAQKKLQEEEERARLEKERIERARQAEILRAQLAREEAIKEERLCKIQEETARTYISLLNERKMKNYFDWLVSHVDKNYSSTVRGAEGKIYNHVGHDNLLETAKKRFDEKVTWTDFKILSNTRNGIVFMIKMTWPKSGYVWGTQCWWKFSEDGIVMSGKWDPNGFNL